VPITGWIAFAILVGLSTTLAVGVARHLPFALTFSREGVATFGCALAPFLLGLAAVLVLKILPGAGHGVHYAGVSVLLVVLSVLAWTRPSHDWRPEGNQTGQPWSRILVLLVVAFVVLLLFDAVALPLTQSDSLEYAYAGARLFRLRTLAGYPPLDPAGDPSGFYGPWTHPPLYAALIYMADICQGGAAQPGLMRLLSPWAMLSMSALVYSLGSLGGRRVGQFAVLFLLGTPLLFLGADSALVDAFPASAVGLGLAACVGFSEERTGSAAALGAVLGVGMWSHSQAVLLIPLALFALFVLTRSGDVRGYVRRAAVVLLCALAIGIWPYLWNLHRAGVLISDNPPVFALLQLNWAGYFRSARDLDSVSARVQYGILKGWFALEAYSVTFWFMSLGALITGARWVRVRRGAIALVPSRLDDRLYQTSLGFLLCYFGGVVFSTLAGIDLMIRTERYLLMMMVPVALLAAVGAARLTDPTRYSVATGALARNGSRLFFLTLLVMWAAQILVLERYRRSTFDLSRSAIGLSLAEKLHRWGPFSAIEYIRANTPQDALVLAFKPSDMFYSGRKMLSFMDPRMIPVYLETNPQRAVARLRNQGVEFVYMPDYTFPVLYNSVLLQVFADPTLSRLEHSLDGYQVYSLHPAASAHLCDPKPIGPGTLEWRWSGGYVFGGRKRLLFLRGGGASLTPGVVPAGRPLLFQRDYSRTLESPVVPIAGTADRKCSESLEARLDVELTGHGFASVYLQQFGGDGRIVTTDALGGTDVHRAARYSRRFWLSPEARALRVLVEHRGVAEIGVEQAALLRIGP